MTAKLSVLVPTQITDAMLTSSTIAETDYAAYDNAHTYALGDRCIAAHRIFESQIAANIGHPPTDPINQFGTIVYWLDVGPTNRWAMFDGEVSSQSTATTSMTVVLKPGPFNAIYIDGMDAANLSITVKNSPGGTVIFTFNGALQGSVPTNYYDWYFMPFAPLRVKLLTGIAAYNNMELTATISGTVGSTVKCGVLAVGLLQVLGQTQQGAKAKPKNYGYVKIDDYGRAVIKKGKAATDVTASAKIDSYEARNVQAILEQVIGGAGMLSCSDSDDYSGLTKWGLISGEVTYLSEGNHNVSVSLEGII